MMNVSRKTVLVFCEFYLGCIGIGCLILLIYILSFPMFIEPNKNGTTIINTNRQGELIFEFYFVIFLLILALFSLFYFIYYRSTEHKKH